MIEVQIGDSRQLIHGLKDKSIDCVVTSPPYWGLRDYGHADQIGLEKTPEEYLKTMLDFFDDVKMKLKDEGNCFVNLGDSYFASGGAGGDYNEGGLREGQPKFKQGTNKHQYLKPKSLVMIPQRFAWGMIERHWVLRNEIIWAKPNHMPESVTDRLTKSHEVIYHFVKQQKYYYDLDAIREPHKDSSMERYTRPLKMGGAKHAGKQGFEIYSGNDWKPEGYSGANTGENNKIPYKKNNPHLQRLNEEYTVDGASDAESFGSPRARTQRKPYAVQERTKEFVEYRTNLPELDDLRIFLNKHRILKDLTMDEVEQMFGNMAAHHWFGGECYPSPGDWIKLKEILGFNGDYDEVMTQEFIKPSDKVDNPKGKNPGDVWYIPTAPYPESHFAVFPLELVRRPILAGCPIGGTVLDPFAGSGTVGEFCRHNDRNAILFELNPEYKKLIEDRAMLLVPELSEWCSSKEDA